jgi:hypothetical protein
MPEGMPVLSSSCFLLGLLMYSAIVRVEYPEIGSNFMPTLLCIVLVFWIAYRIKAFKKNAEVDSGKDFHDPE